MPIERLFLDWNRPPLGAVIEALQARYARDGRLQLGACLFVFPGGRAQRRFLDLLSDPCLCCDALPQTITIGKLPELLYASQFPFANELTQELAWAEALCRLPTARLRNVGGMIPDDADVGGWLTLGQLLAVQHRQLAADRLQFVDVVTEAERLGGATERLRWEILSEVQQQYLQILDSLKLWDKQTARIVALQRHEFATDRDIVLVGLVDLNRTQREMLDQVEDRVTALIAAPFELANRFDSHGCLIPEQWDDLAIDLSGTAIHLVEGPNEQAEMVLRTMSGYNGRYAAGDIIVGLGDESLVPVLRRSLDEAGIPTRAAVERTVPQTLPALLLEAVASYLQSGRTSEFLALLRHPDLDAWLVERELPADWIERLDQQIQDHLPSRPEYLTALRQPGDSLAAVHDAVNMLLGTLRQPPQLLSQWREPIVELLLTIYNQVEFQTEERADRLSWQGCKAVIRALDEQQEIPARLCPAVTGAEALRMTLAMVEKETIPPAVDPSAVELLGWLELSLDDAPAQIITSFNEGRIPTSMNADPFLPNHLRRALQIEDNARRYARDAYALCLLAHSRESLTIILASDTAEGDPLIPSRLLFATDDATIAQRVARFSDAPPAASPTCDAAAELPIPEGRGFRIPRPLPGEQVRERISVTAFGDYLAAHTSSTSSMCGASPLWI